MALYMILGDTHIRSATPVHYVGSYVDDLFDTLYASVDIAKKYRVSGIVQAGDFWDAKTPRSTTHGLMQRAIDWVKAYDLPFYVTPGNHDMTFDRLSSIYETQPLGVLFKAGAIDLRGWAEDAPIYGVPWQQRWTDEAVEDALDGFSEPYNGAVRNPAKCLVVTHAPLFPPGQEPQVANYEYYPTANWAKAMGNKGSVYYGHVHEPHGIYEVDGVTFCNNGAISRAALTQYNLTREVYATIWDSKTGEFERVVLPHKPASEIFKVDEVAEKRETERLFDELIESIKGTSIEITSIDSVVAHIRESMPNISPRLLKMIESVLEEVDVVSSTE